ncbi:MAG: hypothetical protein AVO39_11705 [delta proteobacterium MLS_D]|jgi:uncharacterized protein|nr:MAG: hypothetical protein AVO39_11705 [delta proteobacterium MLS_D]
MTKTDNINGAAPVPSSWQGFHILAKPIGPLCNLNCGYCFYKEKKDLFAENEPHRMSERVLEAFVEKFSKVE